MVIQRKQNLAITLGIQKETGGNHAFFQRYRRISEVTALFTFGFCSPKGQPLSSGLIIKGVIPLIHAFISPHEQSKL